MNQPDTAAFLARVRQGAKVFQLAGETENRALWKALEYELSLISGKTEADVALLQRTIAGKGDY